VSFHRAPKQEAAKRPGAVILVRITPDTVSEMYFQVEGAGLPGRHRLRTRAILKRTLRVMIKGGRIAA
jgi:hypothetical protein